MTTTVLKTPHKLPKPQLKKQTLPHRVSVIRPMLPPALCSARQPGRPWGRTAHSRAPRRAPPPHEGG